MGETQFLEINAVIDSLLLSSYSLYFYEVGVNDQWWNLSETKQVKLRLKTWTQLGHTAYMFKQ